MLGKALFTSEKEHWETPGELFQELDKEFAFTLDVCASEQNAKCRAFFTKEQDGLQQEWTGRCWCNPPYGRDILRWVEKAHNAVRGGQAELVVMLLPARTDTTWFHDYIYKKEEIRFIRGRVRFELGGEPVTDKNGRPQSAPFPSMVVVFRREKDDERRQNPQHDG